MGNALSGYTGFAFGEGRLGDPFSHTGGLMSKDSLRLEWENTGGAGMNPWEADSISFSPAFEKTEGVTLDERQNYLTAIFESNGIEVSEINAREVPDSRNGIVMQEVEIKVSINTDLEKLKCLVREVDSLGDSLRLEKQAPAVHDIKSACIMPVYS